MRHARASSPHRILATPRPDPRATSARRSGAQRISAAASVRKAMRSGAVTCQRRRPLRARARERERGAHSVITLAGGSWCRASCSRHGVIWAALRRQCLSPVCFRPTAALGPPLPPLIPLIPSPSLSSNVRCEYVEPLGTSPVPTVVLQHAGMGPSPRASRPRAAHSAQRPSTQWQRRRARGRVRLPTCPQKQRTAARRNRGCCSTAQRAGGGRARSACGC